MESGLEEAIVCSGILVTDRETQVSEAIFTGSITTQ